MREQENLKLFPQPSDGTLTLYYYGEFDAMSADSDENKLAQVAPDLIIYSGLSFAADYYLDQRAEIFEQKYQLFLTEIQEQANDQELNGGTQSIAPAYEYGDIMMATSSFFKTSGTSATTESTIQTQVNAASTSATNAAASRPQPQHLKLPQPLQLHQRRPRSPTSSTPSPQPRRLAIPARTQLSPTTRPTTASTSPFRVEMLERPARLEPQEQRQPSLSAQSPLAHPVHLPLSPTAARAVQQRLTSPSHEAMSARLERPAQPERLELPEQPQPSL